MSKTMQELIEGMYEGHLDYKPGYDQKSLDAVIYAGLTLADKIKGRREFTLYYRNENYLVFEGRMIMDGVKRADIEKYFDEEVVNRTIGFKYTIIDETGKNND